MSLNELWELLIFLVEHNDKWVYGEMEAKAGMCVYLNTL